jgi:hypothetical protein
VASGSEELYSSERAYSAERKAYSPTRKLYELEAGSERKADNLKN